MMEVASRPLLHAPPTASHHPLHSRRYATTSASSALSSTSASSAAATTAASSSSSAFAPAALYQSREPSRQLRLPASTTRRFSDICPSNNTTIPSISHVKESIRGLPTPPSEMTTTDSRTVFSFASSSSLGSLKTVHGPAPTSVDHSRQMEAFQTSLQNYKPPPVVYSKSPASRRSSEKCITVTSTNSQPQPTKPKRRQSTTNTKSTTNMISPPFAVNSTGYSLADFAARITCLFWFESTTLLQLIAESKAPRSPTTVKPLSCHATPSPGFQKWINTIVSTTQVSQNVVLLALLFVHRLKKLNPTVQGKLGSEFRLFTVALMLGNKYLDDNTYTNKTWAEVSGINVQEVHVMEVEFLSNMRYSLYVGQKEWKEWQITLGRLWDYVVKAGSLSESMQRPSAVQPLPRRRWSIPPPLPSPPSPSLYIHSQHPSHSGNMHPKTVNVSLEPPCPPTIVMPVTDFESVSRKRSFDYSSAMQPPSKRITRSSVPNLSVHVPQIHSTLPPLQCVGVYSQPILKSQIKPSQVPTSQPPLQPARSIALPLPDVNTSPATSGSVGHYMFSPFANRQSSPYSAHHSVASSPITPIYGSQRSPCSMIGHRDSPYRPVRGVNTLLVPPHSETPVPQQVAYDRMHYQPLAKVKSEQKTGVVPYLLPEVSWSPSWHDPTFFS